MLTVSQNTTLLQVKNEGRIARAFTVSTTALVGNQDELDEAEKLVKSIKIKFLQRMNLPVELLDPAVLNAVLSHMNSRSFVPMPVDFFATDDTTCRAVLVKRQVPRHSQQDRWVLQGVASLIITMDTDIDQVTNELAQLKTAANRAKEDQVEQENKIQNQEIEHLNAKVAEAERVAGEWKSRGERVPDLEHQLEQLRGEVTDVEELNGQIATLRSDNGQLDSDKANAEAARDHYKREADIFRAQAGQAGGLVQKNIELDAELKAAKQALEDKNQEVEGSSATLTEQRKMLGTLEAEQGDLFTLIEHLLCVSIDPNTQLDIRLLRPFLAHKDQVATFFNAVDDGQTVNQRTLQSILPQKFFADRYVGHEQLATETNIWRLVGVGLKIGPISTLAPFEMAIELERGLVPSLSATFSQENVAMIYHYAMNMAANAKVTGQALGIACGALRTLRDRYPHSDDAHWVSMLQTIVASRYPKFNVMGDAPPVLDQVALFQLALTIDVKIVAKYCDDVSRYLADNSDPMEDVAMVIVKLMPSPVGRMCIAHHSLNGEELVLLKDWNAQDQPIYAFWRSSDGMWAATKTSLTLEITSGSVWILRSTVRDLDDGTPVFEVAVQEPSSVVKFMRQHFKNDIEAAMNKSFEVTMQDAPPLSDDEDEDASAMDVAKV